MFTANTAASTRLYMEFSMSKRMVDQLVPLSLASSAISKFSGQAAPNYRSLWKRIVDGELTGIQRNGRWYLDPAQAAQELGLTGKTPKSAA
jgi:hypothetical protein